jgi:hypothetical protein
VAEPHGGKREKRGRQRLAPGERAGIESGRLAPRGEKIMTIGVVSLPADQVLAIAQADAARVYRDLSLYRIQLVLEDDGWHVDYELKSARLKGGGPHYLIDPHTGAILSKRYEQ